MIRSTSPLWLQVISYAALAEPQLLNKYQHTYNNPLPDPTGQHFCRSASFLKGAKVKLSESLSRLSFVIISEFIADPPDR